jgi:tripartite-type tricarboxylate transporter receptor subunit TctC
MYRPGLRVAATAAGMVLASALLTPAAVPAQEKYPSRPIELVVPWGPGGGADQLARLTAKLLEPVLRTSIPVLNVPGATGGTGMAKLLAAPADGYSMAIYIADSHALLAGPDARWKAEDIVPVAVMVQAPSFLFVADNSRFKTWADFEKEAKANPGTLKVATLGFGSVDDFTLKYLEGKGLKVVQVPFSKPSERYVSVLGGHADALFEQAGDVAQFLQSKQMRPLVVFGKSRYPAFKDVPSSFELGHQIALPQFRSIVVRAGTPPERVQTLSTALAKIAGSPEYKKFLEEQFAAPDSFIEGAKASAFVRDQLVEMKKFAGTKQTQ